MGRPPRCRLHRTPGPASRNAAGVGLNPPTTFHLIRHAAHALLPHTLAGRMPGVPLSPEGRAQAQRLADRLPTGVTAIASSPVLRAMETASPLANRLQLDVTVDQGFEEIDFGAWTGRRFEDLAPDPAWQTWNRLRSLATCPGGETMHHAQSRALASLHAWRASHFGRSIVIVSHADIIKALLAPALGLPLDRLHRLTIDPAALSTLVVYDDDVRIDRINST